MSAKQINPKFYHNPKPNFGLVLGLNLELAWEC